MPLTQSFEAGASGADASLVEPFLASGYVTCDVEDREALDLLRREVVAAAARLLDAPLPDEDGAFLGAIHRIVPVQRLNAFRLDLYRGLNALPWFRPTYFRLASGALGMLVGNELAMQNRINLSIQLPHDTSSLLQIHADVFSGETPFQVVQWLPLVDVERTKSMFILPRPRSEEVTMRLADFATGGIRSLFEAVKADLVWPSVPYGKMLLFSPNFLHGNVVNQEPATRWSLNCRFTGLFTPYGSPEKALGSFYLPITIRPVTRLGLAYRRPDGFRE